MFLSNWIVVFLGMEEKVLILDFGSQYTQLIARRVRELFIYCEIHPYNNPPKDTSPFKAVILSGRPFLFVQKMRLTLTYRRSAERNPF